MKNEDTISKRFVIIYILIFFTAWTVNELFIFENLDRIVNNGILAQFIKEAIIKNLIWTLPAIILIVRYKNEVKIKLKYMFYIKINLLKYLPLFIFFTLYILVRSYFVNKGLYISNDFGIDKLIIVLFVGLTEEIVFRGWLLNILYREEKKILSYLINSLLFLAIHFPIWISKGDFFNNFTNLSFLVVIFLSLIFSYIFIKNKNLVLPILLHMYWDLLIFMF